MTTLALNAREISSRMRMGKYCLNSSIFQTLALFFCFTFSSLQALHAQTPAVTWLSKEGYKVGYQLSTAADTIQSQEQFNVNLYLETLADTEAVGAFFSFQLPDQVTPVSPDGYSLPFSNPLGSETDLQVENDWNASTQESNSTVQRIDGVARSVNGQVLTLHFETGNTSLATADLVQAFDGGAVMEDNLDMKRPWEEILSPKSTFAAQAHPNPCQDWIAMRLPDGQTFRYVLRDMTGALIKMGITSNGQQIDMRGIPSGILDLQIENESDQMIHSSKIVKR